MQVENFVKILGSDFYTGIPDSQLKALCNYLMNTYGISKEHHIIAANEGNCVGLAAGYHLATGKVPVVYLQNSGVGNIINPVTSLLNDKVYAIPMIFVIGWRGEPGVKDEPQHIYQGEVTLKLLDDIGIASYIISKETTEEDLTKAILNYKPLLDVGKNVAFVIRKDALKYDQEVVYDNDYLMTREDIIKHIVDVSGEDPIICTTGKASRELFEVRETKCQEHKFDFLTVGSMGHSSSIALGVALNKSNTKVWCVDGDGAVLMHLGSMPIIGNNAPNNFVHILINNCAHETVGGMPSVAANIDWLSVAKACGYPYVISVNDFDRLDKELNAAKLRDTLTFIEVKSSLGSREDLGRPKTTALENKMSFMEYLSKLV